MILSELNFLKKDEKLEERLKESASHKMTVEEIKTQTISFIYGQLMNCAPEITCKQVKEAYFRQHEY